MEGWHSDKLAIKKQIEINHTGKPQLITDYFTIVQSYRLKKKVTILP